MEVAASRLGLRESMWRVSGKEIIRRKKTCTGHLPQRSASDLWAAVWQPNGMYCPEAPRYLREVRGGLGI